MQLGIFAKTFPGSDSTTVLAAVRAAGYDCAQFNLACAGLPPMPDAIGDGVSAEIAAASRASGVALAAVSGTYNMVHPDPAVRVQGMARLGVLIPAAPAMGTRLVTLCTGTRDAEDQWRHHPDNATPEAWADLLVEMEKAIALAEEHDVDLGIEPELANVVASAAAARRLIDELQSPRLRIVLDPANLFEVTTPAERARIIEAAVDLLADRIAMAHAKDRDAAGGFATAGKGVVDFGHFIACLRAAHFTGPLVTHGLDEAEAPGVASFLRGSLA